MLCINGSYVFPLVHAQCQGKDINWSHIVALYLRNAGAATGLNLIPKLKYEHVYLTSHSKMRVDLAAQVCSCVHACTHNCQLQDNSQYFGLNCDMIVSIKCSSSLQVLSSSVAEALYLTGGPSAYATAFFHQQS